MRNFLSWMRNAIASRLQARPWAKSSNYKQKPVLETLEDRNVPAVTSVTSVVLAAPGGFTGSLSGNGLPTTFNFTVNATGDANTSEDLIWTIVEPDGVWPNVDDELWFERIFTMNIGPSGTGAYTGTFILFNGRSGIVKGPDESSGEVNPDPIYVLIERSSGTDLGESNTLTVTGTAYTQSSASTAGTFTVNPVMLVGPAGLITGHSLYTFTVNISGTPNTTIENLRWSVIEPDTGEDDELVWERSFDVPLGANSTGTFTAQFILYADTTGEIGGVDEKSGETAPDPIYVLIEDSGGTDLRSSNSITVRGRL